MRRPTLVHFIAVETDHHLAVKAFCTLKEQSLSNTLETFKVKDRPSSPMQSVGLIRGRSFKIKIVGLNTYHQKIFSKVYESDSFGNFSLSIPQYKFHEPLSALEVFEVQYHPGIDLHLGTFIPLKITGPRQIVISDFDKTLVDTRYSTTKEIYQSITNPVSYFPSVQASIDLIKEKIDSGFQPFILTASPHFYENAIRDWLYQNEIFTAGIFLKDYRKLVSLLEGDLYPKDIKAQGFYKLNQLVEILLMTGIPNQLVLMGDCFESDPLIYMVLQDILQEGTEPWDLWKTIKQTDAFRLTRKQNSHFLNRIYLLRQMIKEQAQDFTPRVDIFIRKNEESQKAKAFLPKYLERSEKIQFYLG